MKVLFITYQGDVAGSTYSISYLAKGLAQCGDEVFVACRRESLLYKMLLNTDVNLIVFGIKGRFDLASVRKLAYLIKKNQIDIINAQSSYDRYTSVFAKYLYSLDVKVIHTRRQMVKSVGGFFQNLIYNKGTDGIVAVSNGVKQSIIEKGIPENKIEVIYNGIPLTKVRADEKTSEMLKNKWNIHSDEFIIGCIARRKNQIDLIKSLHYIDFPVRLILVGIAKTEEDASEILKLKNHQKVVYAGKLSANEALEYYPILDVKVLPSVIEGLSQSLLEAMAFGIPVMATNVGGNPDLIQHNENGLLFEDGDVKTMAEQIIMLKNDIGLYNKLAINGKKTATVDFSIENTVKNYRKYFNRILNKNHETK